MAELPRTGCAPSLADVPFRDPVDPAPRQRRRPPLTTAEACRAELVDHLTTGVDWIAAVAAMAAAGVTGFVEVGPGRVLSGLIRRIAPDAETIPLDDPDAPGGLADPEPSADSPHRRAGLSRRPTTDPRQETPDPCASPTSPAASPSPAWASSARSATRSTPSGATSSTGVSGLKRITYWDPEPYDCKVAGEVPTSTPTPG